MYDRPENRAAHDAFWTLVAEGLRARGIAAPDRLNRDITPLSGWQSPDLVLGQICNLPLRLFAPGQVTRIGVADYGLTACPLGHYRSALIVRRADSAQSVADCGRYRLAYNEPLSHSGWGAAWAYLRAHNVALGAHFETGSHRASLHAVASGAADLAAIDCMSLSMMQQYDQAYSAVRVIGHTPSSPGMTFITAGQTDPAPYFAAISAAITALRPAQAAGLGLRAIVHLPDVDYDRMAFPPAPAAAVPAPVQMLAQIG